MGRRKRGPRGVEGRTVRDYGLYYNFKLRLLCLLSLDRRTLWSKLKSLLIIFGQSHAPAPPERPFSSCHSEGWREGSVSRLQTDLVSIHPRIRDCAIDNSFYSLLHRGKNIQHSFSGKNIQFLIRMRFDNCIWTKWTNALCKWPQSVATSQIADLNLTHGRGVQIPPT